MAKRDGQLSRGAFLLYTGQSLSHPEKVRLGHRGAFFRDSCATP